MWFRPPLPVADAIYYVHQLAQSLQYIHHHGYLHGSLTFTNILVLRGSNLDNEPDYAPFLLADVGLTNFVRRFGQPQNQSLPITTAPEQYGRRVTPASDQFALAVLLYFWLTARPPYVGTPEEIEHLKLSETIALPSSLNPDVTLEQESVLLRALSVYPEDRYPSLLAFADSLLTTLASQRLAQADFTSAISTQAEEELQPAPEVEAVIETENILQTPLAILAETEVEHVSEAFPKIELTPIPESITQLDGATSSEFGIIPETEPMLFSEPVTDMDGLNQTEPAPTPPPTPAPSPAPEPIPAPHPEPDIPQPLPEPNVPQPAPNPIPAPQPDIPQTPTKPDIPQPAPDPIPQPVPDVPQPLPEPTVPQTTPQTLPQAEYASISELTDYSELLPQTQQEQAITIPRLILVSPYAEQPAEFRMESDEITLGRAGSSDILLDQDNLTSRHHALLKHVDNAYLIYDRRSANGVFVNGQKIDTEVGYELTDGDHISIGNYEIIFRLSPVMSLALE